MNSAPNSKTLRRSLLVAALACSGCFATDAEPQKGTPAPGLDPQSAELELVDALDLLLVVDNSGSMASEQVRLAGELERLIRVLTLGDRSPEVPAEKDRSNTARYFNPVKSLHLGVISTNVGGIDNPFGQAVAINSCRGYGDGGRLQSDITVARDGVVATWPTEFEGFLEGEVVLPADPTCALDPGPSFLELSAVGGVSAEPLAQRFRCMARLGVRGCPFEQPFEALRLALASPASSPANNDVERNTHTHNAGFLREKAALAVVFISDEDDCSIDEAGEGLFDNTPGSEAEARYGREINLRCARYGESEKLLWGVERLVGHLKALKPGHPERLFVTEIVGVPVGLPPELSIDQVLALPDMQLREEGTSGLLAPSCVRANADNPARPDKAIPPRRFLELAKQLGPSATVTSICSEEYGRALAGLVDRVAPHMAP